MVNDVMDMTNIREQALMAQRTLHDAPVDEYSTLWSDAYATLETYGDEALPRTDRIHALYHDTLHNLGATAVQLTDVLEDVHNRVTVMLVGSRSETGLTLLESAALVHRGSKDLDKVQGHIGQIVCKAIESGNFSAVQSPLIRQVVLSAVGASRTLKTEVQGTDDLFTKYIKAL